MFCAELRHGIGVVGEQRDQLRLAEAAALDEAEIVDQTPSSSIVVARGVIEPGAVPPTSA